MAEPTREQIMAAIATQLGTIKAGPMVYRALTVDYYTTPSLVTRSLRWITQYDQPLNPPTTATQLDSGPVLGVVRGSGSRFSREQHVADSAGAWTGFGHEMRLIVWGYVKATADVLAGTWLERLWSDHMRALLVDPRLDGLVKDIVPDGDLDTDDGVLEPLGYFAQDWLVLA